MVHELAEYFNKISHEFEPQDVSQAHSRVLPKLLPFQGAGRIRAFKKSKSMVKGDIFLALMRKFADLLKCL